MVESNIKYCIHMLQISASDSSQPHCISYPDLVTYFSRALDLRWLCKCSKFSKKSTSGSALLANFDKSCSTGCSSLHSRA